MISTRRAIRPMLMVLAFLSLGGQAPAISQICRVDCGTELRMCLMRSLDPAPCYAQGIDCIKGRGGF